MLRLCKSSFGGARL